MIVKTVMIARDVISSNNDVKKKKNRIHILKMTKENESYHFFFYRVEIYTSHLSTL